MMEQGLAQGGIDPRMIEQVKLALLSGVTPEELLAQNVPLEVIEMAIAQLQAEQAPAQGPVTETGQGLAPAGLAQQGIA